MSLKLVLAVVAAFFACSLLSEAAGFDSLAGLRGIASVGPQGMLLDVSMGTASYDKQTLVFTLTASAVNQTGVDLLAAPRVNPPFGEAWKMLKSVPNSVDCFNTDKTAVQNSPLFFLTAGGVHKMDTSFGAITPVSPSLFDGYAVETCTHVEAKGIWLIGAVKEGAEKPAALRVFSFDYSEETVALLASKVPVFNSTGPSSPAGVVFATCACGDSMLAVQAVPAARAKGMFNFEVTEMSVSDDGTFDVESGPLIIGAPVKMPRAMDVSLGASFGAIVTDTGAVLTFDRKTWAPITEMQVAADAARVTPLTTTSRSDADVVWLAMGRRLFTVEAGAVAPSFELDGTVPKSHAITSLRSYLDAGDAEALLVGTAWGGEGKPAVNEAPSRVVSISRSGGVTVAVLKRAKK